MNSLFQLSQVTPAHDPNDYACGQRNKLGMITIFDSHGKMNENSGQWRSLDRFDARKQIISWMESNGFYRGSKENKMSIALCSRSGDILEPLVKPQWYVKCDQIAATAAQLVRDGKIDVVPESYKQEWFRWLGNRWFL
jgi:valyl-tRNA synthetase